VSNRCPGRRSGVDNHVYGHTLLMVLHFVVGVITGIKINWTHISATESIVSMIRHEQITIDSPMYLHSTRETQQQLQLQLQWQLYSRKLYGYICIRLLHSKWLFRLGSLFESSYLYPAPSSEMHRNRIHISIKLKLYKKVIINGWVCNPYCNIFSVA